MQLRPLIFLATKNVNEDDNRTDSRLDDDDDVDGLSVITEKMKFLVDADLGGMFVVHRILNLPPKFLNLHSV